MQKDSRILIIGHQDSVDNALTAYFKARGFKGLVSTSEERIDVLNQLKVNKLFAAFKPTHVLLGSVRSGGIVANTKFPAEFIYENCQAQSNIIHAAYVHQVVKLLYFTSSCMYPKDAKQPMAEQSLLTGALEETSEAYAVAKIAGTKMCQAYRDQYGFNAIVAVPATLYGPGSDSDIEKAHVMGALIAKFVKATKNNESQVTVWGTGKPRREFMHVDDFVKACVLLLDKYQARDVINVGVGEDVSIKTLVSLIAHHSGYRGKIVFDKTKPDGAMRKLMNNKRLLKLGFKPTVSLEKGIAQTIQWYRKVVA